MWVSIKWFGVYLWSHYHQSACFCLWVMIDEWYIGTTARYAFDVQRYSQRWTSTKPLILCHVGNCWWFVEWNIWHWALLVLCRMSYWASVIVQSCYIAPWYISNYSCIRSFMRYMQFVLMSEEKSLWNIINPGELTVENCTACALPSGWESSIVWSP